MPETYAIYLGGLAVAIIGFFVRHHFVNIYAELAKKASKDELNNVRQELRDANATHSREIDRVERSINERITSFERAMRDQIDVVIQLLRNPR